LKIINQEKAVLPHNLNSKLYKQLQNRKYHEWKIKRIERSKELEEATRKRTLAKEKLRAANHEE
jgi:hypothetical protein